MVQTDPKFTFSSAMVTVDLRRRLKAPKVILEALGWTGEAAPTVLIAEIVELGHLRFWSRERVAGLLLEIESDLHGPSFEEAQDLRAHRDRYREVTLRPSDGRIQLSEALHAIVEPALEPCLLYAELGEGFIDLFSQRGRLSRLRKRTIGLSR